MAAARRSSPASPMSASKPSPQEPILHPPKGQDTRGLGLNLTLPETLPPGTHPYEAVERSKRARHAYRLATPGLWTNVCGHQFYLRRDTDRSRAPDAIEWRSSRAPSRLAARLLLPGVDPSFS